MYINVSYQIEALERVQRGTAEFVKRCPDHRNENVHQLAWDILEKVRKNLRHMALFKAYLNFPLNY